MRKQPARLSLASPIAWIALTLLACRAVLPGIARAAGPCEELLARRKVTLLVPYKPGGGHDVYARLLAPVLQERTGARVAVANLAGANGMTGIRAVANAGPDTLTLGVFDLADLLAARLADPAVPPAEAFIPLGSFGASAAVWATRDAAGPVLEGTKPLTIGVSSNVLARVILPATALGREVRLVRGYSGTPDRWLALLRGDVDVTDGSSDSIGRYVASSPGTHVLLALSDKPLPEFPGVPYLAGEGGIVDTATRGLDAGTRRTRMDLARLAAQLATSSRDIVLSQRVGEPMRSCLREAVEQSLFGAALREAAGRQKAPLEPLKGAAIRDDMLRIEQAIGRNSATLKRLAAGS